MPQFSVLICGSGIAGSVAAYWLGQAGMKVRIVERSPSPRNSGLGVDIRGPALEIIRMMGLEGKIRNKTTGEEGLVCVDSQDRVLSFMPISEDDLANNPTSDIEIMRSDLAQLLLSAALPNPDVSITYNTSVQTISQDISSVTATFTDGTSNTFDILIAADGLSSSTRRLILPPSDNKDCIRSLGQYTAYFTIPWEDRDEKVWKWYLALRSRWLLTRPKNETGTCAYFSVMPHEEFPRFEALMKAPVDEQKAVIAEYSKDAGWQAERLVAGMWEADDFYLQHIAQVKLPKWSSNRCALLGDAAYCASPLSGVGTSLAVLGGYVLAGEITRAVGQKHIPEENGYEDVRAQSEIITEALEEY